MNTKGVYKSALFLISAYIVCWLFIYVLINQDLNVFMAYEYFILAWSFNGLERPMFIWMLSNALFIPTAITYFIIKRKGSRNQ